MIISVRVLLLPLFDFMQQGEMPRVLERSVTLRVVMPIGIATAGDILLSNLSFTYATVSFYTIVKSGSLIW